MVLEFGADEDDPIAIAGVWRDQAKALRRAGRERDAGKVLAEASALERAHPEAEAKFVPVRYDSGCEGGSH